MEYLIRFSQSHETFRLPEIEALAVVEGVDFEVVSYSLEVGPSCPGGHVAPAAVDVVSAHVHLPYSLRSIAGGIPPKMTLLPPEQV